MAFGISIKEKKQVEQRDTLNNDLSVVYVRDFGDEYHQDVDITDPVVRDARNIRRRYQNPIEFAYANIALDEYLETLVHKYGGPNKFKLALELGLVTEYLPPIPKMKGGARIRSLMASGRILGNKPGYVRHEDMPTEEELMDILEPQDVEGDRYQVAARSSDEYIHYIDNYTKLPAYTMMMNRDNMNAMSQYRNSTSFEDLAAIFAMSGNTSDPDIEQGNGVRPDLLRLSTAVDGKRMHQILNPEENGRALITNPITGNLITRSTSEKLEMVEMFRQHGWNSVVAANIINDPRVTKSVEMNEEIQQKKAKLEDDTSAYIRDVMKSNGMNMAGAASLTDLFGG